MALPQEGGDVASERLKDIRAVTDARLAHLDLEDLLVELLDRVRIVLDVDTAAVLLLDEDSGDLVARAARGIEEEVRQGVRVPLRQGFAGRIAAEKRPAILDRVDDTTVTNPILWEKGIKAMLGVPLLADGRVLGVLHVGTLGSRQFTHEDTEVLQLVAQRIVASTQARLADAERAAADALQRGLLPAVLPVLPGLELAARYVSAGRRGVGGDWYDVFRLPSGDVWVVAGDVAGHGLRAAIVMGRLRSTVRAYALSNGRPDEVLTLTDRKMEHFELGELATVVCAVFSPPFDEAQVCGAGHPPPVLTVPGRPAVFVDVAPAPPLGTGVGPRRCSTTVELPPGAVMFFYTDGLVERRGRPLDEGLDRLLATVHASEPHAVCHRVMDRLVGTTRPDDDVAILAVRRSAAPDVAN